MDNDKMECNDELGNNRCIDVNINIFPPELTNNGEQFFVFMIKKMESASKNEAKICVSETPFRFLNFYNGTSLESTSKPQEATKPSNTTKTQIDKSGGWEIEMIVGKFCEMEANSFASLWRSNSRGIVSRRTRGNDVIEEYIRENPDCQITCYDKRIVPMTPNLNILLEEIGLSSLKVDPFKLNSFYREVQKYVSGTPEESSDD
jgi:hypothetical protein